MSYAPPRAPGDYRPGLPPHERLALVALGGLALVPALFAGGLALDAMFLLGIDRWVSQVLSRDEARFVAVIGLAAGIGLVLYANRHATDVRARLVAAAYVLGAFGTMFGTGWLIALHG